MIFTTEIEHLENLELPAAILEKSLIKTVVPEPRAKTKITNVNCKVTGQGNTINSFWMPS